MTTTTLNKRLEKLNLTKQSKVYQIINDLINGTNKSYMIYGNIIRPCHTSGSGRFTTNLDYTEDLCICLNRLGLRYKAGNDSPRGGKTGNYIKLLTTIKHN